MKWFCLLGMLLVIASCDSALASGADSLSVRILMPSWRYEILLGDTLSPQVVVVNRSLSSSAPTEIFFRIRNDVTGLFVYQDSARVPSIASLDSLGLRFRTYRTSPNILSELGTFTVVAFTRSGDSATVYLYGIRQNANPFRDLSDNYGKTSLGDIPDQTKWVSAGAEVVDGDSLTWDPPPPINAIGEGPDSLHAPMIELNRKDASGSFYSGAFGGDTIESFPINLNGHTSVELSFEYFRGGPVNYGFGWDSTLLIGPERTIVDAAGNEIRPGDSLILEFKDPSEPIVNVAANGWNRIAAIDGGHDLEFQRCVATGDQHAWKITLGNRSFTLTSPRNYLDSAFRFRFRLQASNDAPSFVHPMDDADTWFIDNIRLMRPALPQIELSMVRVECPYTVIPRSQAMLPVVVRVRQSGAPSVVDVPIDVRITNEWGIVVYSERIEHIQLGAGADSVVRFPHWDASHEPSNVMHRYQLIAALGVSGFDDFADDDTATGTFYLRLADRLSCEFAYDDAGITPGTHQGNDIPVLTKSSGDGIGFRDTTGSFALRFVLLKRDTLYGAQVYFANGSQTDDPIRIGLYSNDSINGLPRDTIATFTDVRQGAFFDQFWPYYFPKPVILPAGVYWISVSQLSNRNFKLGGDLSRGGAEVVAIDSSVFQIHSLYADEQSVGTQWGSGEADNNADISGDFVFEMPATGNGWRSLMPTSGVWPAMDSKSHLIPLLTQFDSVTWTGAGTYLPMIRPLVGRDVDLGIHPPQPAIELSLDALRPDPYDPSQGTIAISFTTAQSTVAAITIYNILGVPIRRFTTRSRSGQNSVEWDGKTANGAAVAEGTYILSVVAGNERTAKKMLVHKQ